MKKPEDKRQFGKWNPWCETVGSQKTENGSGFCKSNGSCTALLGLPRTPTHLYGFQNKHKQKRNLFSLRNQSNIAIDEITVAHIFQMRKQKPNPAIQRQADKKCWFESLGILVNFGNFGICYKTYGILSPWGPETMLLKESADLIQVWVWFQERLKEGWMSTLRSVKKISHIKPILVNGGQQRYEHKDLKLEYLVALYHALLHPQLIEEKFCLKKIWGETSRNA